MANFITNKKAYLKKLDLVSFYICRNGKVVEVVMPYYKYDDVFNWEKSLEVKNNLYDFKIDISDNESLSDFHSEKYFFFDKESELLNYLKKSPTSQKTLFSDYLENPTPENYKKCYDHSLFLVSDTLSVSSELITSEDLLDQIISLKYLYVLDNLTEVKYTKKRFDLSCYAGSTILYGENGSTVNFESRLMGEYDSAWGNDLQVRTVDDKEMLSGVKRYFVSERDLFFHINGIIQKMQDKVKNDYEIKETVIF